MSPVVNLRLARKRKERAEKQQAASENRALYGRKKEEKRLDRMKFEKASAFIDGHKRATGGDSEEK